MKNANVKYSMSSRLNEFVIRLFVKLLKFICHKLKIDVIVTNLNLKKIKSNKKFIINKNLN